MDTHGSRLFDQFGGESHRGIAGRKRRLELGQTSNSCLMQALINHQNIELPPPMTFDFGQVGGGFFFSPAKVKLTVGLGTI